MGGLGRIIVALDFPRCEDALSFLNEAGKDLIWCKVGMELFTREGPIFIETLKGMGKKVFLDLKFHDIPNSVRGAVRSASSHGVDMLTIHSSGGRAMVEAASEEGDARGIKVLAVTVLTSLGGNDFQDIGFNVDVGEIVLRQAGLALSSGAHGIVCSPLEIKRIRKEMGLDFIGVTPGIRLERDQKGDQKRIATPEDALGWGADFLVIGRSLTGVDDPAGRLREIRKRLEEYRL
jgi:orotidine-5'-phosphate decarboxylase